MLAIWFRPYALTLALGKNGPHLGARRVWWRRRLRGGSEARTWRAPWPACCARRPGRCGTSPAWSGTWSRGSRCFPCGTRPTPCWSRGTDVFCWAWVVGWRGLSEGSDRGSSPSPSCPVRPLLSHAVRCMLLHERWKENAFTYDLMMCGYRSKWKCQNEFRSSTNGRIIILEHVCYLYAWSVRAGVCRPCVETELTATERSGTDGDWSVTTLDRHKRAYDRIQLVADIKYPMAEIHPRSRTAT